MPAICSRQRGVCLCCALTAGCLQLALVQPKRRLQARTFRIQPEFSIMVGGSARVDVLTSPSRTLYLTVYASMSVPCYMARTSKLESK